MSQAMAQDGLTPASVVRSAGPGWAPRSVPGESLAALGDWYLTGPGFGEGRIIGGLRATGGLIITPRPADGASRAAYLGIGYSGVVPRAGLAFSANLGLTLRDAGAGLRLPRAADAGDDIAREWRLRPILQIGVSYAF